MKNHIVLAFLLCAALIQDILTRKIKNRFNLFSLAVSFLCVIWSREIKIWDALAGFACSFILGILLWRIGAIRAGDAKFMWTVGVLKGWKHFLFSMAYSILAGGVIGIFVILVKKDGKRRMKRLWRYLETIFLQKKVFQYEAEEPEEFPFSIPLAVGCLLEYFYPI